MSDADWTRYSRFVADKAVLAMKRENLTQASLGKRMNRSQQYVSHILDGRENLTLETLSLLDSALNLNLMILKNIFAKRRNQAAAPMVWRANSSAPHSPMSAVLL